MIRHVLRPWTTRDVGPACCNPGAKAGAEQPHAEQLAAWLPSVAAAPQPRYEPRATAVARTPFLAGLAAVVDRRRKFDPDNLADSIAHMRQAHAASKAGAPLQQVQ